MDALKIKQASAMPAPTWGWLRMNDTAIEIPAGLERARAVTIEADEDLTETNASFEGAVEKLQERLDAVRADAPDTRACVRAAEREQELLDDLDTPALSAYQLAATRTEVEGDISRAFETGIGVDARSYLNFLAGGTVVLATEEGACEQASVRVAGQAGHMAGAAVDVVCQKGSTLDLTISLDGDARGSSAAALIGSELRVFAGEDARVSVTVYITADDTFTVLDDSGYVLDEGARVSVRHVVLGGAHTYTGLASDLRGDASRMEIDTRYLASGDDTRDFNYVIRHRGRRTFSNMDANGVLTGNSKKILRGTIDLIHGCKGAEGSERETVLLANRGVDNKTVPTILCDEDDVAGNHGATIGHVRPEQLFYLGCRGLSQEQAEALFTAAKLEDAALSAPDEQIRANVIRLGSALIEDFADFEEEIA